jgi:hypothetical protein
MKKLKIEYTGGYNQVSNYLIREHDANFAVIVDALVNIFNMNIDNLTKVGGKSAVKISNGYLSRNTGLGLSIVKSNVEKIEGIGLITAIKKGKGNTRHYMIHIEHINSYIKALETNFKQWFDDSLQSSKKEKLRSEEADKIKVQTSFNNFEKTMNSMRSTIGEPTTRLVENRPTKTLKIIQPKQSKSTVVDINKKTNIETTTSNNVVVEEIFNQSDSKGMFYKIDAYDMTIYRSNYESYISRHTKDDLDQKLKEYQQQEFEDILIIEDEDILDNNTRKEVTEDSSMMHIYDSVKKLTLKKNRAAKRKFETTKEPASFETSVANWKKLEDAYTALSAIANQGKFQPSKKDKLNFNTLSEHRQEYVIDCVESMKSATTTASRPKIYIERAMKDKLRMVKNSNVRLNVCL